MKVFELVLTFTSGIFGLCTIVKKFLALLRSGYERVDASPGPEAPLSTSGWMGGGVGDLALVVKTVDRTSNRQRQIFFDATRKV